MSAFKMIDVGGKAVTHRVAVASGEILLSEKVRRAIQEKAVPKGDVLTLAEIAGITAAKRTADILPLCHPLPLDAVHIQCEVDAERNRVVVHCTVSTHGRTGVEMEALTGVSAALLCIYDLTKALDKGAEISAIRLEHKRGGKSGEWWRSGTQPGSVSPAELSGVSFSVITVSDSCSRGERDDESGQRLTNYIRENGGELIQHITAPDEIDEVRDAVQELCRSNSEVVLITGGTGVGPRDTTPEALEPLWTKKIPGFGETFRSQSMGSIETAWLSRAEAGLVGRTLVVMLPGSPGGVRDGLAVLDRILPHLLRMIDGGGHT